MARAPQRPSLPALGLLDPEILVLDLANSWLVVYLKAARMIHNALFYYWRLNCLSGFDFELGKVSRGSDLRTHCYFYNPLERKWLERTWFGKYGISWHISVRLWKYDSRLQW